MAAVVETERRGRSGDAAQLCDRGLRRFPGDYYLLMKRLEQARLSGDRSLAEALLQRAAASCPVTAATFSSVGEEYARLGKMEMAEDYFRQAMTRLPSNALLGEKLAMALVSLGKMDEGIQQLIAAADAEPGNHERRGLLAKVLLQAGRWSEAVALLAAVPAESLTWDSLMCLSMARARLDGKDPFVEEVEAMEANGGSDRT